uniref:Uncharacterized protein n=2 Tax=Pygocentrus nattereri TaxID=42514 RepID=A0A3B4CL79_PYGNA
MLRLEFLHSQRKRLSVDTALGLLESLNKQPIVCTYMGLPANRSAVGRGHTESRWEENVAVQFVLFAASRRTQIEKERTEQSTRLQLAPNHHRGEEGPDSEWLVIRDAIPLTSLIITGLSGPYVDMATGRKSSTSKGGGVHFPDDAEEDPLSNSDDTQQDKVISAIAEPDGTYLVKVGFLRIQHKYEIVFTIPQVPTLGKDATLSPALRTMPKPRLRASRIIPRPEGGVKVVCEYSAQQEGVVQEELTLVNRSRRDSSIRVRVQARVMDRHHGTPMLLEGVRCLGTEKETATKTNDRKKI